MRKNRLGRAAAVAVMLASGAAIATAASRNPDPVVDTAGNLRVPADYRSTFQYIGSWAVAADAGMGAKEMHSVYASPGSVAAYKKSGHFPDGAVLVKEVHETQTGAMTTGTVSRPGRLKGWFVMVKDSTNSRNNNPLWGDGWGWSWFDAGDPTHTTSTNYKSDCQSCHVPAKATDWIYVSGYEALRK